MSERTPQDVLREALERAFMATDEPTWPGRLWRAMSFHEQGALLTRVLKNAGYEIRPLDKAIAEAPDSPPLSWRALAEVLALPAVRRKLEARAFGHAAIAIVAVLTEAAPDTLSEKPGLADLDWLMGRVVARFSDSEYHRAKDIILRMAGFPTARALKETVRSGSTDSEGR